MNELHDKILAALPASMRAIEAAVGAGVAQQQVWDAVHTLRRAGIIRRYGGHGARMFEKVGAPPQGAEPAIDVPEGAAPIFQDLHAPLSAPIDAAAGVSPGVAAAEEKKRQRKERKRPVILFWIPGWPSADPNRRMVWSIVWNGTPTAERELKRLRKKFRKDAEWELASMSPSEVQKLREKGFSLAEQRERERLMRERDAAAGS